MLANLYVLYVLDMDVTDWHDNLLQHIGMRVSAVTEGAGLDTGNADLRGDVSLVHLSTIMQH